MLFGPKYNTDLRSVSPEITVAFTGIHRHIAHTRVLFSDVWDPNAEAA